jgi:hypothetical protein
MHQDEFKAKMVELKTLLEERWEPKPFGNDAFGFPHISGQIPLSCYTQINPVMEAFLFRAMNTLPVELQYRPLVLEYMSYVNSNLPVGNWAMEPLSGEIRWKSGIYFAGHGLSEGLMRNVIDSSLVWIYHTLMGIVTLQTGGTMEKAIESIGKDYGRGIMKGMKVSG